MNPQEPHVEPRSPRKRPSISVFKSLVGISHTSVMSGAGKRHPVMAPGSRQDDTNDTKANNRPPSASSSN